MKLYGINPKLNLRQVFKLKMILNNHIEYTYYMGLKIIILVL